MISNEHVIWRVRREYNRDRMHETERYRLVRQACRARRRRNPFYCQALTGFGQCLVRWGSHLQEHYATLADPSVLSATNQNR
jgi:hypothetical protein